MKYKNLTKDQLLISFDRLTRFKHPKDKYLRVFGDIILSNLIEPKYKRTELEALPAFQLRDYAVEIINSSLKAFSKIKIANDSINQRLKQYEMSVFVCDSYTQELLDNNINYWSVLDIINDDCVVNLRWLKNLPQIFDFSESREKLSLKYPIDKILLVEGLTEETLLPAFSRYLGYDFYKHGIQIIPAGGKNQVVKLYYRLIQEVKIPIFLLLDKDAEENISQIKPKLRDMDKIHLVSCGEFEDLLPDSLIIKSVNKHLNNFASISADDLDKTISNVKNLENIFKEKGLHEFKKAEFAKLVKENIDSQTDISDEISDIIRELQA